jgi:hypothetical protein
MDVPRNMDYVNVLPLSFSLPSHLPNLFGFVLDPSLPHHPSSSPSLVLLHLLSSSYPTFKDRLVWMFSGTDVVYVVARVHRGTTL